MSRRGEIRMSEEEVRAFLALPGQVLNVASTRSNGDVDLVPMWYGFAPDGSIAFTTFTRSQKVVNWRRSPRFTALVETGERYEELRGVELVGSVRFVDDEDDKLAIVTSVTSRYPQGPGQWADQAAFRKLIAKRIGVKLDVEKTISWDHAKLGGRY